MDWTLEVVILPVSDIDRSVAFYRDQVGFELDHDTTTEHMHVVQLTPRGSGCSIVFGDLPSQREMAPGSIKGLQLCVADAQCRTRGADLAGRRMQRDHGLRRERRWHVLRLRRSRRQHVGGPAAQGPRREAADPGGASRTFRRLRPAVVSPPGRLIPCKSRAVPARLTLRGGAGPAGGARDDGRRRRVRRAATAVGRGAARQPGGLGHRPRHGRPAVIQHRRVHAVPLRGAHPVTRAPLPQRGAHRRAHHGLSLRVHLEPCARPRRRRLLRVDHAGRRPRLAPVAADPRRHR